MVISRGWLTSCRRHQKSQLPDQAIIPGHSRNCCSERSGVLWTHRAVQAQKSKLAWWPALESITVHCQYPLACKHHGSGRRKRVECSCCVEERPSAALRAGPIQVVKSHRVGATHSLPRLGWHPSARPRDVLRAARTRQPPSF